MPPKFGRKTVVEDTGKGIRREAHGALFTPFSVFPENHAHGHWLGLAITQKIVEQFGGELVCRPNHPKGTQFAFKFECEEQEPLKPETDVSVIETDKVYKFKEDDTLPGFEEEEEKILLDEESKEIFSG